MPLHLSLPEAEAEEETEETEDEIPDPLAIIDIAHKAVASNLVGPIAKTKFVDYCMEKQLHAKPLQFNPEITFLKDYKPCG